MMVNPYDDSRLLLALQILTAFYGAERTMVSYTLGAA